MTKPKRCKIRIGAEKRLRLGQCSSAVKAWSPFRPGHPPVNARWMMKTQAKAHRASQSDQDHLPSHAPLPCRSYCLYQTSAAGARVRVSVFLNVLYSSLFSLLYFLLNSIATTDHTFAPPGHHFNVASKCTDSVMRMDTVKTRKMYIRISVARGQAGVIHT